MPKLIWPLGALFNYVVKVIKPLYNVLKAGNHWFATYHTHYKDKFETKKPTYKLCLQYSSGLFDIIKIQTNNILILANNNFANKEKVAIKFTKTIIKNQEYVSFLLPLKFNGAQIKLYSEGIILTKKSHIGSIFLVINYDEDSTSSKRIIKIKFFFKE